MYLSLWAQAIVLQLMNTEKIVDPDLVNHPACSPLQEHTYSNILKSYRKIENFQTKKIKYIS